MNTPSQDPADNDAAIADYGFLSDCHSAALVSRSGSIDWWCVPRFDSPFVLGRLLGAEAGHWSLRPAEDFTSERQYVGDSLVVRTVFRTSSGEAAVTDALALLRAPGTMTSAWTVHTCCSVGSRGSPAPCQCAANLRRARSTAAPSHT